MHISLYILIFLQMLVNIYIVVLDFRRAKTKNKKKLTRKLIIANIMFFVFEGVIIWKNIQEDAKTEKDISSLKVEVADLQNKFHLFFYFCDLPETRDRVKRELLRDALRLLGRNHYDEAISTFLKLFALEPSDCEIVSIHLSIGNAYSLKGNFDEALGSYKQALDVAERINDQWAKG